MCAQDAPYMKNLSRELISLSILVQVGSVKNVPHIYHWEGPYRAHHAASQVSSHARTGKDSTL